MGNAGYGIVEALLAEGFQVTAIKRRESESVFPSSVAVRRIDVTVYKELLEAFTGQDTVVSVVGLVALRHQIKMVDAAVAAGVQRFIPSEFGCESRNSVGTKFGDLLAGKIATSDYLIKVSGENPAFSWTGIAVGNFFE